MKYVAWLYKNHQHKNYFFSKLSSPQISQFITYYYQNKQLTEYILSKKLYNILNCSIDLENYDLNKLNLLANNIPIHQAILLCQTSANITKYNANDILKFIHDKENFINKKIKIEWGPGNHKDPKLNLIEHYQKHVLSKETVPFNELAHWKSLLTDPTCESYGKYAIESFYKMQNVIVHSNGTHVYLSGFYGTVFIIGRYNGDVFGISSCYVVESGEKNGRFKYKCFDISFME